jgi:cytochrome c-type biogenesis protein CcmH
MTTPHRPTRAAGLRATLASVVLGLTFGLAFSVALGLALLPARPAAAVQPDEVLADAALEARAREISRDLRCLVCRNESIDESNAPLARDLRLLVRERLIEGDTNPQVIAYIVDRYGEYVLLRPLLTGANGLLYMAGPAMLFLGLAIALAYLHRRRSAPDALAARLSGSEKARLAELMKD